MSGIVGIIHFDGRPVESGQIEAMSAKIAFRGPDGIAHWHGRDVALGHLMLHTTTESLVERQPLANEDGSLVLVMDGRVDNWEDLRRVLLIHGARLRDTSDAELVLRAFELWRADALERIDGDFALAIWDVRQRELFCARDRMGNKPFHYHWNGSTFAFASDLAPLLDLPWVKRETNEGVLAEFLAAQWYSRDETLWQGIYRLVAAHRITVTARGFQPKEWWQPDPFANPPAPDDAGCIDAYRALFVEQVRRASRSHRPVTCEVSGGLDSSAVYCIAERLRKEGRLTTPGLRNYSIVFPGIQDADEVAYARAVGNFTETTITEVAPSNPPLEWYALIASDTQDFPGFPNAAMSAAAQAAAVAAGSRVLLTGEGGDDWLQGSELVYAESIARGRWRDWLADWHADVAKAGRRHALRKTLRWGVLPLLPPVVETGIRALLKHAGDLDVLAPQMLRRLHERQSIRVDHQIGRLGQKALQANLHDAFNALVMEACERSSVRTGLEPRHPMNSAAMVEFAFSTAERLRLREGRRKFVHVQAMAGWLPPQLLARRDKAEFSTTFQKAFDSCSPDLVKQLAAKHPTWLSDSGLHDLWRRCRESSMSGAFGWRLWSIILCAKICPARFVDGALSARESYSNHR